MRLLDPRVDAEAFFAHVRSAPSRVLLLDYDGTLAPFRVERDQAVPWPEARAAVVRLLAEGTTRVVVISGRAVDDLRPLLGVEPPPEIWGTHGWERLRPGEAVRTVDPGEAARAAHARAREAAEALPDAGGRVEVKPATVAVHVRGLPDDTADALLAEVRRR
ncbi:MAG: trehalose-phosphatase, partial [Rhodothermales bacterium]|nr:trehalose-phosphatase [Rhodothermales bacterium]